MGNLESEVKETANHILDFFKRSYPKKETLSDRIDTLLGWAEEKELTKFTEQTGSGLYAEKLRAQKLRELYEEGNLEKISEYAINNMNTMTGGWRGSEISNWNSSFHNETTFNHLKYIEKTYADYVRESKEFAPFYKKLIEEAKDIESEAIKIRKEITTPDFKQREIEVANEAREISCITSEIRKPVRELYLLEEFKRKEQVIPLLKRVEDLYSSAIELTKAVIELSKQNQ